MALYKGAASEAGRALQLKKKREKALEELEHKKRKIEEELKLSNIENKFATHYDAVEQQLKSSTIGLVTLTEMKAKQEGVVKERERQLAQKQHEKELMRQREIQAKLEKKAKQKRQIAALSFRMDDEENDEDNHQKELPRDDEENDEDDHQKELPQDETDVQEDDLEGDDDEVDGLELDLLQEKTRKKKIGKNPDVDTSFLPDREREEEEMRLREEFRQEWVQKQEKLKNEEIGITFSYWDGSGHRRSVKMKKGNSIYQFLQKSLELLRREFHELRAVTADQLMYVKEDLIIPHHSTFYDFIVTKARGKSGPLFNFDVHDDIRLIGDASVEKEDSHAGKVLLRNWYERNKHIFPASRWEPFDPEKNYEKYTVTDRNKH